jgi:heme exporter protein D
MDLAKLVDYGPYVWGAYATCALALVGELVSLRLLRRHTGEALRDAQLLDALARQERAAARGGPA